MLIFLIGFMGAGKSTAGKKLAVKLGFGFTDLDEMLEEQSGRSVSEWFRGPENKFRGFESGVLRSLDRKKDLVVATGGGTPCFNDNMDWMNLNGITVYLEMSPASLVRRILQAKKVRPLVSGKNEEELLDFVNELMGKRVAVYEKSLITVKGEDLDMRSLLEEIGNHLDF